MEEPVPQKPSLRNVQTPHYGAPKSMQYKVLQDISRAHVESFNFVLREGLYYLIQNIQPLEIELPNKDRIKVQLRSCKIGEPTINKKTVARTYKVYPAECRNRQISYKANCVLTLCWSLNGALQEVLDKTIGEVPIMVKSDACSLQNLTPKQLIAVGEEENEFGGYFIINGLEKVVRLLIMQRRNYPIAMQRSSWKKRGNLFTEYGISIRCVRSDQTASNMVLHYLSDGTVKLMFTYKRNLYFVPVMLILKALVNENDYYIYKQLVKNKEKDTFFQGCVKYMLRQIRDEGIIFQNHALDYLGMKFRVQCGLPEWYTPADVAKFLLQQCICVHLENDKEKFDLLIFMIKKLFAVTKKECALENPDNPMNQEILLPGHLYMLVLKERIYSWLGSLRQVIEHRMRSGRNTDMNQNVMRDCIARTMNISRPVENVFSTGSFLPKYESSLMQYSGLCIIADKLNFWRYVSHFRAVHRGAFFAQMRTSTVRKLLPEAWGFLCPVHTPDGAPCGLLNHMTSTCEVVNVQPSASHGRMLLNTFYRYGVLPYDDPISGAYTVIVDGRVTGWLPQDMAHNFVMKIRRLKSLGQENIPKTLEICLIPKTDHASQYPGVFIFSTPARMMRPVKNLMTNVDELIGTMEQVYLHIALKSQDIVNGVSFHQEISTTNLLSILGNQIPFSDYNQSPRNMYECQMGKQTMGTPCLALKYRSDNKLYRLLTPQSPIVRPKMHDYYHMDDYPLGTNAVVAVVSYTGFDMEDAIILNKSAVEKGFTHGTIYKTQVVNLRVIAGDKGLQKTLFFARKPNDDKISKFIDEDGLPLIGTRLAYGDPICSYIDTTTGECGVIPYKSLEEAYVEDVKLLGNDTGTEIIQEILIKFRVPRNPIIGDKFASRHGQKGICGSLMPMEDMPFTERGIIPDIIFNPHGFPSRMTIGMLIECMAGKAGAHQGVLHDATPFQFSEDDTALSYFGECLRKAGFDYQGTEKMYSGVTGEELQTDIFCGIIYYQRLRHMVADKYQVRTTGPVDPLTRQPVKGRKRDGGIRFGEMERDSLIAHGASLLLHDRLFTCSDGTRQYVCQKCGNLLSCFVEKWEASICGMEFATKEWTCRICGTSENVVALDLPYVFRYLCAELAAMNIKVKMRIEEYGD